MEMAAYSHRRRSKLSDAKKDAENIEARWKARGLLKKQNMSA
jgi:hypothetical protein